MDYVIIITLAVITFIGITHRPSSPKPQVELPDPESKVDYFPEVELPTPEVEYQAEDFTFTVRDFEVEPEVEVQPQPELVIKPKSNRRKSSTATLSELIREEVAEPITLEPSAEFAAILSEMDSAPTPDAEWYMTFSIRELKQMAKEVKLPRYGSLRKAELVAALIAHQSK